MKRTLISAIAIAFLSLAAHADSHTAAPAPAPVKKPEAPQGMGKNCNPACGTGTYCVDGQCVDNAVKKTEPATTKTK